jgi:hypothetical protein
MGDAGMAQVTHRVRRFLHNVCAKPCTHSEIWICRSSDGSQAFVTPGESLQRSVMAARTSRQDRQTAHSRAIGRSSFAEGICSLTDMQDTDP